MTLFSALALLAARLLLACVFGVAGIAKLADLEGSRRSMAGFGIPTRLAGPAGVLLPVVELAVAVALLPTATATWGATAALGLLVGFVTVIGVTLLRGRQPDCNCFGQLHSEPISPRTVIRNVLLSAVAAGLVWRGWSNADPCALGCINSEVTLWALTIAAVVFLVGLAAAQWWLLLNLTRQSGRLLLRLQAIEARLNGHSMEPAPDQTRVGKPAPRFRLPDTDGRTAALEDLLAKERPLLVLFSDPGCPACSTLTSEIAALDGSDEHSTWVIIISRGEVAALKDHYGSNGPWRVLMDLSGDVFEAYGVPGTPSAALIRPDGTLEALASGAVDVRKLWLRTHDEVRSRMLGGVL